MGTKNLSRWLAVGATGDAVRLVPVDPPSTGPDVFCKLQDAELAIAAAVEAEREAILDGIADDMPIERAKELAGLWRAGKLIGGDAHAVSIALLNALDPPQAVGSSEGLSPLPEQAGWGVVMHDRVVLFASNAERAVGLSPGATTALFTAAQMRSHAAEAVASERARCAKLVETMDTSKHGGYIETTGDLCDALAECIRLGP